MYGWSLVFCKWTLVGTRYFTQVFLYAFILVHGHSFCSLTNERSIAFSKGSSPSAHTFNFQCAVFSLRSSSSFLHLHPQPSLLFFCLPFLQWCVLEGSFYARCDQSSYPSFVLSFIGYSCPLWLSVTLLHFTWSVQLISILQQNRISELSRYFWYTIQSVQVSAPYKTVLQM